jgi:peroxiredoxin
MIVLIGLFNRNPKSTRRICTMAKDVSAPKVGEEAPDFTLKSHLDTEVKLSDFRGKKNVVMAFFPLAFTPV